MSRMSVFNSPLMLGFEPFEQLVDRISKSAQDTYPPYNIEQLDEFVALFEEQNPGNAIDGASEFEAVESREIPLELVAVAHHQSHPTEIIPLSLERLVT